MPAAILATKLYIPPPRPRAVVRPRLLDRLNTGLRQNGGFARKLTLISAPAGFGKTVVAGQWVAGLALDAPKPGVAWLSLDEGDSDPARFLPYLIRALQTIVPNLGAAILVTLQTPQPPPLELVLTALLNEIAATSTPLLLVLDDYHLIDSQQVDHAVAFLVERLPPQMHLVIATREDPPLPLARLRGRGQLVELRAADLCFTADEAADFLNKAMDLNLPAADIASLAGRTEGWIAGLQLAALALQGASPAPGSGERASYIAAFTSSHRFVLDYLLEEVLEQQPQNLQTFLLRTSILHRMCGPLCDAVVGSPSSGQELTGQKTLEHLERANLFTVSLDNERRWHRYHHLFGSLLRQRLGQSLTPEEIAALHIRASEWYEDNGLMLEAFRHAAAANDLVRVERLIESKGMGLHYYGVATAILDWLDTLPQPALDARPVLRVRSATLALMAGRTTGVEEKLLAAERCLPAAGPDSTTRTLTGQIACARATLALMRYDPQTMRTQARRALEYLPADNWTYLFTANWALASACSLQGDRAGAMEACQKALAISQKGESVFSKILVAGLLGNLQKMDNQLYQAAATLRHALELAGEYPHPNVSGVQLNLAQICYEWNDLEGAERHGQLSLQLSRQFDLLVDRFIVSEVFLAHLKLARGDLAGAAALLAEAEQSAHQRHFALRQPEIAAGQVLVLLRQGQTEAAAQLARQHALPLTQARVLIAQNEPSAALALLEPLQQQMEARGWLDEQIKTVVLQAVALHVGGKKDQAAQRVGEALALAEPGGFVRLFVDEGAPMAQLLSAAAAQGKRPEYANRILAAFQTEAQEEGPAASALSAAPLVEPLTPRELDVLRLIAQGLSNQEIGARLFLALDTVKGHNRRIFDKLQVQRRTEAIARAGELGLL